ncbi:hypothetical protein CMO89_01735 [Candidatus Woesearchaeota archaeon]|nr:hypothetical protein [Candidatus Woesearchaeota archaeon]|tara:strand:- start:1478 stop:1891 length:414 start_codon:yes stop_codon:yes gene_type:complete
MVTNERIRLAVIAIISMLVIATGTLFAYNSFMQGKIAGAVLGTIIAIIIVIFAVFVFKRGNEDLKKGFPLKDERSRKVLEKASSKAFYVSLYLLIAIGLLSDKLIKFRDISQATSVAVGGMAILFAVFWAYYNKREL